MGHDPGVVLVPTFHVQDTLPDESDCLSYNPWAVEFPDLYRTVMLYVVFGLPDIVIVA